MKLERINENKIRCILTSGDLSSRQIMLGELAYGSDKAKALFRDMMDLAAEELGFETDDMPIVVEAVPMENGSIVLVLANHGCLFVQRCAYRSIGGNINVVGVDMGHQIAIDTLQDFLNGHGKVIEGHGQVFLHVVRHMERHPGNVHKAQLMLGSKPRVNEDYLSCVFDANGSIANLRDFHNYISCY